MTPTRIGRYEILRPLGKGAMGVVYLAQDPQIERTLALKTVRFDGPSQSFSMSEAKARFLKEAKISGRLQHPNIVTVYDVGEDDGVLYLAMEYISGGSLSQRLAEPGSFPLIERIRVLSEVADALSHAHQRGVLHRDVKPANILLTDSSAAKVTDFGIGKLLTGDTDLTTTGQMVGSPAYMSPEQVRGDKLDVRSDIFSLGVVLYQTLTLRKPFPADTLTTLVYQILHDEPLDPLRHNEELPPEITEIARRCLAKNREERYGDAAELADDLRALIGIAPLVSTTGLSESKVGRARAAAAAAASAAAAPPTPAPGGAPQKAAPPPPVDLSASRRLSRSGGRTSMTSSQHSPAALAGAAAGGLVLVGVLIGGFFLLRSQGLFRSVVPLPEPTATPTATPTPNAAPAAPTPAASPGASGPEATPTAGAVLPPPSPAPGRTAVPTRTPRPRPTPTPTPLPTATPTPTPTPPPLARPDATVITRRLVKLNVTPDQARVFLDDRFIGISDDWDDAGGGALLAFASDGRHRLRFTHPDRADYIVEILVTGNAVEDRVEIEHELRRGTPGGPTGPAGKLPRPDYQTSGLARLAVDPPFARVSVDGHDMGTAGRFVEQEMQFREPGVYNVVLTAPGYQPKRLRVVVSSAAGKDRVVLREKLKKL
ncbi:MAG TPA: serine/threonine-protein kinase [Thermoanaerobaculia bacterium]|nr:serine/threonine-protein kinase [Thermoanaerobaculia bacterium]HQP87907.1 serine/threonine-protein kinase [Thermoanaerobaculia bacterium]